MLYVPTWHQNARVDIATQQLLHLRMVMMSHQQSGKLRKERPSGFPKGGNRAPTDFAQAAILYIGATTIGFGAPIYETAIRRAWQHPLIFSEAIVLVILVQVCLPLICAGVRHVLGQLGRIIDIFVYGTVCFVILRGLERLAVDSYGTLAKALILAAAGTATLVAILRFRTVLLKWLATSAALAPVLALVFLWQVWTLPKSLTSPPESGVNAPPVIIVVMDELDIYSLLHDDNSIDTREYPNFSRLSANSVWFRNTSANYAYTAYSFPSFLNGSLAAPPMQPPMRTALFNALTSAGYKINIASNTWDCYGGSPCSARTNNQFAIANLATTIRLAANYYVPTILQTHFFPGITMECIDDHSRHAESMFRSIRSGNAYLFHSMITHTPPLHNAKGALTPLPWGPVPYMPDISGRFGQPNEVSVAAERANLRYADAWLGKLFAEFDHDQLWDRIVLAVISDHGTCNADGCRRFHPVLIQHPIARLAYVPFFLRAPGIRPRINDRPAELVDVAPTVAGRTPAARFMKVKDGIDLIATPLQPRHARIDILPTRKPPVCIVLPDERPTNPNQKLALLSDGRQCRQAIHPPS